MDARPVTAIKICCIRSAGEAQRAVAAGATALGFVSAMPSGPGVIPDELIASLIAGIPPEIDRVLLTSRTDPDAIIAHQRALQPTTLQLVDAVSPSARRKIKHALPGVRIMQVVHVTGEASLDEAVGAAETADLLLLDSGNPALAVKELGGTGRTHDWRVSAAIRGAVRIPVFLAGGLTPGNVASAVETVRPFGVDVCSGVRTNGLLDEEKLRRFMASVPR